MLEGALLRQLYNEWHLDLYGATVVSNFLIYNNLAVSVAIVMIIAFITTINIVHMNLNYNAYY